MQKKRTFFGFTHPAVCCLVTVSVFMSSAGVLSAQEIETERSGLVYSIGRVERAIRGAALIDMGYAHTLDTAPPHNKVALFRATESRYVPVGVLTIAETYMTVSLTEPSAAVKPQVGDVVFFVRELSELKTPLEHRDEFIREELVKNANQSEYTSFRRDVAARALRDYTDNHRKWVMSTADVVGFLNGPSYEDGRETRLQPLLNYIGMIREDYRVGRNSLSAAGRKWDVTVKALMGPTATVQHFAAQPVEEEGNAVPAAKRVSDQDLRRLVRESFFDRSDEEINLLAYLVASLLEYTPRNQDVWFRNQLLRSQFPALADEEFVLEEVRDLLRDLNDN